eukprot:1333233-Ditylum_brightwellii.AAC.1
MTTRSKHIGVKYHWVWNWIDGTTACVKLIASAMQKVDILTKPLVCGEVVIVVTVTVAQEGVSWENGSSTSSVPYTRE